SRYSVTSSFEYLIFKKISVLSSYVLFRSAWPIYACCINNKPPADVAWRASYALLSDRSRYALSACREGALKKPQGQPVPGCDSNNSGLVVYPSHNPRAGNRTVELAV